MHPLAMNPDEYFLLTVVREARDAIHILADRERGVGLNLHDRPELSGDRLLEALMRLFQRGDIIAEEVRWERGGGLRSISNGLFIPDRPQVARALAGKSLLSYGLTAQGGARWEAAAEADWDLFVDSYASTNPDRWEITAASRDAAERYMRPIDAYSPFPREIDAPLQETVRWEVLEPWQATYWKVLPVGYRMTCLTRTINASEPESFEDAIARIQTWLRQRADWRTSWYRQPEVLSTIHRHADRYRGPWQVYPHPAQSAADTDHWHWLLSYRGIDFSHHAYWNPEDRTLRSQLYRYDPPEFAPRSVLGNDEKPLLEWQGVFEMRDHFVRKSMSEKSRQN